MCVQNSQAVHSDKWDGKAWQNGKPISSFLPMDAQGCLASAQVAIGLVCAWARACPCHDSHGSVFVLSVCAHCFFSLSPQSKTTPFTYSAHCNPSVRFIPVRLKGFLACHSLLTKYVETLLGNCHNNQCIVACMDIYRQVTNFTDILCPFCSVYWGLQCLGKVCAALTFPSAITDVS